MRHQISDRGDCAPYPNGCGGKGTVRDGRCIRCGVVVSPSPLQSQPKARESAAGRSVRRRASEPERTDAHACGNAVDSATVLTGVVCSPSEQRETGNWLGFAVEAVLHVIYFLLISVIRVILAVLAFLIRPTRMYAPLMMRLGSLDGMGLSLFRQGSQSRTETLFRMRLDDNTERVVVMRGEIAGGGIWLGHEVTAHGRMHADGTFHAVRIDDARTGSSTFANARHDTVQHCAAMIVLILLVAGVLQAFGLLQVPFQLLAALF